MIKRFSVSLEKHLLEQFDEYIIQHGYSNRSEAIRDLIRNKLVNEQWQQDSEVVGVVTLVYDHHQAQLHEKITDIQHTYYKLIASTTHVHMDHQNCLEVTIVKGNAFTVLELSERMIALRGVKSGNLTMSSTGGDLH